MSDPVYPSASQQSAPAQPAPHPGYQPQQGYPQQQYIQRHPTGRKSWALGFHETKTAGFFPIGFAVIGYFVLAIAHVIVTIAGTVISGTRVFRNPLSIPFLRPTA